MELTNQYRGKVEILFLGKKYTLMKPSFKHNVFAMFERPSQLQETKADDLANNESGDAKELKGMLSESIGKEAAGESAKLTDWLESITVENLALCIQPDNKGVLLKVGLSVVLKDEGEGKPGRGFGSWLRLTSVKAEFQRDYKDDPQLGKLLKESLLEYVQETQDQMTLKATAAVILAIGEKIEAGEELSEEDLAALKKAKESTKALGGKKEEED